MQHIKLLQNYLDKSYDELLAIARNSLKIFYSKFQEIDKKSGDKFIVCFVLSALSLDQEISQLECNFVNDLWNTKMTKKELKNLCKHCYNDNFAQFVTSIIDSISTQEKQALLKFILCVMAVDETLSREEITFVDALIDKIQASKSSEENLTNVDEN